MRSIETKTEALNPAASDLMLRGLFVVGGAGLLAVSAWGRFEVPGYPVPTTLQTFVVLLAAGLLGSRVATAAVGLYLGLGIAGAPVFAAGVGGWAYLLRPTGGYLIAFVLAPALISALLGDGPRRYLKTALAFTGGLAFIFAGGVAGLLLAGFDVETAVAVGLVPFIPIEIVKLVAATWITVKVGSPGLES